MQAAPTLAPAPRVVRPHDGPQTRFLACRADEALFGGAAGGGKSLTLLLGALRLVHEPSYRALLLRRTYPELQASLIDRSWLYYPALGGRYSVGRHQWVFPSGARITFASIEHQGDEQRFRSDEYQFVGFDELTTFTEAQYVYLLSRLRSSRGLPCRMRAGTNPGGPGHEWVLRRFAPWLYAEGQHADEYDGPYAAPGEIRWFVRDEASDEERVVPRGTPGSLSRTFFPATHRDNPTLTANDPKYIDRLSQLDRLTRRQLREGDWHARPAPGEFFDRSWFEIVNASPAMPLARVRWWDRAATEAKAGSDPDWTVGLRLAKARGGLIYVEDVERFRAPPAEVERRIQATAERDRDELGDVRVCLAKDPGSAGKFEADHYVTHTLAGFDVHMVAETGDKVTRAKPVSAQAEHGNVKVVRAPWNRALLDELEAFPGGHDDQVDALSGAYSQVANAQALHIVTGGARQLVRAQGGF